MLRNVLYFQQHAPHEGMHPDLLFEAHVGDRLPVNTLTSSASLAQVIEAYNQTAPVPVTLDVLALRDTLVHGRALDVVALKNVFAHGRALCADDSQVNFSLMTFSPPRNGQVTLGTRVDLTLDWMDQQIKRIGEALDTLIARFPVVHAIAWARCFRRTFIGAPSVFAPARFFSFMWTSHVISPQSVTTV
jgi:hypothetical protein